MRGVRGTWNGRHLAQAIRRAEKRDAGMCIQCGVRPQGSTMRCEQCRQYHNQKQREKSALRRKRRK